MPTFVDTNVLVYAFDGRDPVKQRRAIEIIENTPHLVVSAQVLGEFFVTVTRKLAEPLDPADATAAVERMTQLGVVANDAPMVLRALQSSQAHQLSYWDALIIEAAVSAGCGVILTEDLATGSIVRGVRIVDPFAGPTG